MPSAACKMTPATCFVFGITNVSMLGIGMRILALQGFFIERQKMFQGPDFWIRTSPNSLLLISEGSMLNPAVLYPIYRYDSIKILWCNGVFALFGRKMAIPYFFDIISKSPPFHIFHSVRKTH